MVDEGEVDLHPIPGGQDEGEGEVEHEAEVREDRGEVAEEQHLRLREVTYPPLLATWLQSPVSWSLETRRHSLAMRGRCLALRGR